MSAGLHSWPKCNTIAVLSVDNKFRVWDIVSGKVLREFPSLSNAENPDLPAEWASSLSVSPDGGLVAFSTSGTVDKTGIIRNLSGDNVFYKLQVRNIKTGEMVWSRADRRGYMHELVFSHDGRALAGDTSNDIRFWDAHSGAPTKTFKPRGGWIWAMTFSPDDRLLAAFGHAPVEGKRRRWLTIWDVKTGEVIHSFDAGESGPSTAPGTLAFSPEGNFVASTGTRLFKGQIVIDGRNVGTGEKVINNVKLWNVKTGAQIWTSPDGDLGDITSLVFSPKGHSLYCCDDSATSRIDVRTGQVRKDLMTVRNSQTR